MSVPVIVCVVSWIDCLLKIITLGRTGAAEDFGLRIAESGLELKRFLQDAYGLFEKASGPLQYPRDFGFFLQMSVLECCRLFPNGG